MNNIVKSVVFAAVVLFAGVAAMQVIYNNVTGDDSTGVAGVEPAAGGEFLGTVGDAVESATEAATDAADSMTEAAADAYESAAETAQDAADAVEETAEDAMDSATDAMEDATEAATEDAAEQAPAPESETMEEATEAVEDAKDAAEDAAGVAAANRTTVAQLSPQPDCPRCRWHQPGAGMGQCAGAAGCERAAVRAGRAPPASCRLN